MAMNQRIRMISSSENFVIMKGLPFRYLGSLTPYKLLPDPAIA
jgi:hypothetical protein